MSTFTNPGGRLKVFALTDSMICSRCHRSVPQKELAIHMASHKSKKRPIPQPRRPQQPRIEEMRAATPGPAPSRPSFEEYMEAHWKSLPKKSGFTTQQVQEIFTGLLKEMGLTWDSIKVGVRRAKVQAEVLFDDKKNLVLNYDDNYFNTLTEVEIRATLAHECCHVVTLPDSTILAPSGDSPQAMFIEIYDEYLAHKEFARRFRGTPTFDAFNGIKKKHFRNYDRIVTMTNAGMMNETNALYTILNDAIYFPLIGDSAFADWCRAKNLPDLNQFLAWIIEDFGFIEGLKLTRMQTMELVPMEAALSATVNYYHLLGDDRTYGSDLFTSTANVMEEMVAKRTSTPLIDVWRKRRNRKVQP